MHVGRNIAMTLCFMPSKLAVVVEKTDCPIDGNRDGSWFEHSVSWLRVCLSAEDAKNVSWSWMVMGVVRLRHLLVNLYVYIYIYRQIDR